MLLQFVRLPKNPNKGVTQVADVRKTKHGKTESRLVFQTVSDPTTVKTGSPLGVTFSGTTKGSESPNGVTEASMDVNKTDQQMTEQDYFI